jgi:hypothetical protein
VVYYPVKIKTSLIFVVPAPMGTLYSLPNPSLITGLAKMTHMIYRSCEGLCGEDDFWFLGEKEAKTFEVIKGVLQARKRRI